jgi:hypothetical protein
MDRLEVKIIIGLVVIGLLYFIYRALIFYNKLHTIYGVLKFNNWLSDNNGKTPTNYHFEFADDTNVTITLKNIYNQEYYIKTSYTIEDNFTMVINKPADCTAQAPDCTSLPWTMKYSSITSAVKNFVGGEILLKASGT